MTTVVVHRRNMKLTAFRELLEERLGKDVINIISRMVEKMTVRIQQATIPEDHSVALSSLDAGNIHVRIFEPYFICQEEKPNCLWSGFLPAEDRGHIKYNTGHDCVIVVIRDGPRGYLVQVLEDGDTSDIEGWATIPPQYLLQKGDTRRRSLANGFHLHIIMRAV